MTRRDIPLFKVLMSGHASDDVARVLGSGHIAQGPKVDEFEAAMKGVLQTPHDVLALNSGTSALHLAYVLAGIGPGDHVVATPMTCSATIAPLVHLGAKIHWADIHPVRGLVEPTDVYPVVKALEHHGTPAKAVVTVDWAGASCDYARLRELIPHRIPIIEDAAHAMFAHRTAFDGALAKPIGAYAETNNMFVCWSTQAIKHLTTGDGGLLACPTAELTERARLLRWFGLDRRSSKDFRCAQEIHEAGYKFHMNDISAAIGLANLAAAQTAVARHRAVAWRYYEHFNPRGGFMPLKRITIPRWDAGSSWWVYTILVNDAYKRDSLQRWLADSGIASSQVHRRNDEHPAFQHAVQERGTWPLGGVDHFAARQLSIPCGWWMSDEDVNHVINTIQEWDHL